MKKTDTRFAVLRCDGDRISVICNTDTGNYSLLSTREEAIATAKRRGLFLGGVYVIVEVVGVFKRTLVVCEDEDFTTGDKREYTVNIETGTMSSKEVASEKV